jgi:hypothetical protein
MNGMTFESNEAGTYFYATWNGKKQRIKKHEFEQAQRELAIIEAKEAAITEEDIERDARELERYIEEAEESNITERIEEIAKEMAPKAKKSRKSKDIAYTYYTDDAHTNALFTLTAKQVDFIKHLPDTYFWENGVESIIWIDCLCDDIQGQFANKPMTVGAIISTLCEKGLGTRATDRKGPRGGKATSFALTEMGQAVAIDLGL